MSGPDDNPFSTFKVMMLMSDNDKSLIENALAVAGCSVVKDAIEEEKRLVNEQLRLGVEPGKVIIVSSGSGELPLLREEDASEGIGGNVIWDYQFELDGKYYNQYINEKEKDTLLEEIDNQPVIEINATNKKSKNKLCELVKSRSVRIINNSEDPQLKEEFKKFSFEFNGKTKSKEGKLPRKFRNGW